MNNKLMIRNRSFKTGLWVSLMLFASICFAEHRVSEIDGQPGTVINLESEVRQEIEEMHQFFVGWFNGKVEQSVFDKFMSRFDNTVKYIDADGSLHDRTALVGFLGGARGTGSDFRIAIRDVKVRHLSDSYVIATYTEWQRQATSSGRKESARLTTLVLSRTKPFRWMHIHETWLPEAIAKAGPYDF